MCSKCFTWLHLFNPSPDPLTGCSYYPYFPGQETEAQRDQVTLPGSQGCQLDFLIHILRLHISMLEPPRCLSQQLQVKPVSQMLCDPSRETASRGVPLSDSRRYRPLTSPLTLSKCSTKRQTQEILIGQDPLGGSSGSFHESH